SPQKEIHSRTAWGWEYIAPVPITERDPFDARFINFLLRPREEDDLPLFDRGHFKQDRAYFRQPWQVGCALGPIPEIERVSRATGLALGATWEGGNQNNPDAKITARHRLCGYESLLSDARRPLNLGWITTAVSSKGLLLRAGAVVAVLPSSQEHLMQYTTRLLLAAMLGDTKIRVHGKIIEPFRPIKVKVLPDGRAVLRHTFLINHNGRLFPHIGRGWFGAKYTHRWDRAASAYTDKLRIEGKATNSFDVTWPQAAQRMSDEAVGHFSTRPARKKQRKLRLEFPPCVYEK